MDIAKKKIILNNDNIKVGLIVSVGESHSYCIETIQEGKSDMLMDNQDVAFFNSISKAQEAALALGCKKLYMCLDNTYDECGHHGKMDRYSYMPLQ